MVKTVVINRNDEKETIKVFFGKIDGEWEVKTEPFNMVVEDAVGNMLYDINKFDYDYLKESISSEISLVSVGL